MTDGWDYLGITLELPWGLFVLQDFERDDETVLHLLEGSMEERKDLGVDRY